MRGVKADTEKAVEKTGGGIETMDVKAALIVLFILNEPNAPSFQPAGSSCGAPLMFQ